MLDREMLYEALHKEIPILTTQIRKLYAELDQKFHLEGAKVPMTFGMDRDCLGSYTQAGGGEREHFHFSLLFVGYSVEHPLSRDDRMDLYKHEYAHYMQAHMKIPEKYQWQTGKHGSAWKYCCSLVGAAPTPYYKAGEALMNHDYDKVLKSKIHDHTVPMRDHYRREQEYKKTRDSKVQYQTVRVSVGSAGGCEDRVRRSAGRLEPPGSRGKALGKVPLEAIVQAGHGVAPVRRGVVGPVPHANGETGRPSLWRFAPGCPRSPQIHGRKGRFPPRESPGR